MKLKIKKKNYLCKGCERKFLRKTNYETHLLICEQIMNRKKFNLMLLDENSNTLPTSIEMFYLVRNLINKCNKLENDIEKLKTFANITKRNLNALDWLNENVNCETSFTEFIKNIHISQDDLKKIFGYKYINGIYYILEKYLPITNNDKHPIKSFNQNKYVFYIYDEEKWQHMTHEKMNLLVNTLNTHVIKAFYVWKDKHQEEIDKSDRAHEQYVENMRIVLGDGKSNEQIIQRLKGKLYNYLKCDLKDIIKYEFVF